MDYKKKYMKYKLKYLTAKKLIGGMKPTPPTSPKDKTKISNNPARLNRYESQEDTLPESGPPISNMPVRLNRYESQEDMRKKNQEQMKSKKKNQRSFPYDEEIITRFLDKFKLEEEKAKYLNMIEKIEERYAQNNIPHPRSGHGKVVAMLDKTHNDFLEEQDERADYRVGESL